MRKKLVIIGIIVLIVGIVISEVVSNFVQPPFTVNNITIAADGFNYMQFNLSNSTALFVFASTFKYPLNLYIMNASAFSSWQNALNQSTPPNGFTAATSLEGNGIFALYRNMSAYIYGYPVSSNDIVYSYNAISSNTITKSDISNKTSSVFYFVFNNMNGNVSNTLPNVANVRYIPPLNLSNIQSDHAVVNYIYMSGGSFLVALVLVIAGIVIIVIGIIKKPKVVAAEVPEISGSISTSKTDRKIKERDELYKSVAGKKQKKKSGK